MINQSKAGELEEMREVCDFLYLWRKYQPLVAGGALWSWVNRQLCRDADIFIKNTPQLEKNLLNHYSCHKGQQELGTAALQEYYSRPEKKLTFPKITLHLKRSIKIDVILCELNPFDVVLDCFDYEHCKVGFGPEARIIRGAEFYAAGVLRPCFRENIRPRELIESKLQKNLWGNPAAKDSLLALMDQLTSIYASAGKARCQ